MIMLSLLIFVTVRITLIGSVKPLELFSLPPLLPVSLPTSLVEGEKVGVAPVFLFINNTPRNKLIKLAQGEQISKIYG